MIPMMLDPSLKVILVGRGANALKRLVVIEAAGARPDIYSDVPSLTLAARAGDRLVRRLPTAREIAAARLVFVADLSEAESRPLAETARRARVPVNVEDIPALCDFHVPATVRRGRLLLTVSTGGVAPGAAACIRAELESRFGADWDSRLELIGEMRREWREAGLPPAEVARNVAAMIAANGWLGQAPRAPVVAPIGEPAGSMINAF